jgi:hypothetical protein
MALKQRKAHDHREMVGVFSDADSLEYAVADLMDSGFAKKHVSLLASEAAIVRQLGHHYNKVEDIEDTPWLPRSAYIPSKSRRVTEAILFSGLLILGAIVAIGAAKLAEGKLSLMLSSGVVGAVVGGLIGGFLGKLIQERHNKYLAEQLGHGGLLLWVRIRDHDQERLVRDILERHSARDVHAQTLTSAA